MYRTRMLVNRIQAAAACVLVFTLFAMVPLQAKEKDTAPGRLLTGKVLDRQDNPVPDAIVYVTDTRTRVVKTYIVGRDGVYRFPALANNVDYEIYAQSSGKASDTKRMSQFDDRKVVDIVLRIDK
ncbi:MAG TPA: carboxypeptidase-like regulatory domain-containing protein [Terriglobales bacterium]